MTVRNGMKGPGEISGCEEVHPTCPNNRSHTSTWSLAPNMLLHDIKNAPFMAKDFGCAIQRGTQTFRYFKHFNPE